MAPLQWKEGRIWVCSKTKGLEPLQISHVTAREFWQVYYYMIKGICTFNLSHANVLNFSANTLIPMLKYGDQHCSTRQFKILYSQTVICYSKLKSSCHSITAWIFEICYCWPVNIFLSQNQGIIILKILGDPICPYHGWQWLLFLLGLVSLHTDKRKT
jgi:hypothetical protein